MQTSPYEPPRVFLVGAGPGHPDLLTRRAVELLQQADVVIYDTLVPEELLDAVGVRGERIAIRLLPGRHPEKFPLVERLMVERAQAGQRVVRLKNGDPMIFGRAGEELAALRAAGIPYEIVPGVTAALAAAAYLEIPLTHRDYASGVALITGHEACSKTDRRVDWPALAAFPGTLVFYMGIGRLPEIVSRLIEAGMPPHTPAAIVSRVGGEQRHCSAPLSELPEIQRRSALPSPGLVIIGEAARRIPPQPWFARRPLIGVQILTTRPDGQAASLRQRLQHLGAMVHHWAPIAIREPRDVAAVDAAIDSLGRGEWDWLVFTSVNGVRAVLSRLWSRGGDWRALHRLRIAAIGPATAAALEEFHLRADVVPPETYSSEGLAAALAEQVAGQRVLLARADRGRDVLPEQLRRTAACVQQVTVYEQVETDPPPEIIDALRAGRIDIVSLTSSNIARRFVAICEPAIRNHIQTNKIRLAAISPVTAEVVLQAGLPVATVAQTYTEDGLVAAILDLVQRQRQRLAVTSTPA